MEQKLQMRIRNDRMHPLILEKHRNMREVVIMPDLNQLEEEIARALQVILARYGHDLPKYFKDVQDRQTGPEESGKGTEAALEKELLEKSIYARW